MSFRVVVDTGLCQGHGVCESEAPAVFTVSRAGELTIVQPTPEESERKRVALAVTYCPTHALSIQDVQDFETQEVTP